MMRDFDCERDEQQKEDSSLCKGVRSTRCALRSNLRVGLVCTGKLRPHGKLDLAAARLHARERLRQGRQTNFFGDEIARRNVTATDGFQCLPDKSRRMMEWRKQPAFRDAA